MIITLCGRYIILCTYTYLTTMPARRRSICIYVCGSEGVHLYVCLCVYRVVYLYNIIILYTIYMATVLGLRRRTKECYLQLSFFDGGLSSFPFGGRIIIIIKKLFFSSSFLSSRARG